MLTTSFINTPLVLIKSPVADRFHYSLKRFLPTLSLQRTVLKRAATKEKRRLVNQNQLRPLRPVFLQNQSQHNPDH